MTNTETLRKKLLFRSNHRGTKEIDLLLGRFADENIFSISDIEVEYFYDLLTENDPDLYDWMTQKATPPEKYQTSLMQKIQSFKLNG